MIEVIIIAGIVVIGGILFILSASNESIVIKKQKIVLAEDKLKIAESKFMKGKIKQKVYDNLQFDMQYEIVSNKLDIVKIKKLDSSIKPKLAKLLNKVKSKSKHKKATISRLLKESSAIQKQLKIVDSMFLKHKITERVYDKVAQEKEDELLVIESEILKLVKN